MHVYIFSHKSIHMIHIVLHLFNTVSWASYHVISTQSSTFFEIFALDYIIWVLYSLFNKSYMDEHLGCFQFFIFKNNITSSILF